MEGFYITTSKPTLNGVEKTFRFLTRIVKTRRDSYTVAIVPVPGEVNDAVHKASDEPDSKKCLFINICPSEEGLIGCIVNFSYERFCSLSPGLNISEGRNMVQPTLEFCRKIFGVSRFTFLDSSSFKCQPSGEMISMGDHNLLVYGQTWYERIFGAKPEAEDKQRQLRMTKLILSENVNKEQASKLVKFVKNTVILTHSFLDEDIVDEFSGIVLSSVGKTSWNGMFSAVNDMTNKRGCEFFTNMMIRYIFSLLEIFGVSTWEIDIGSKPDKHLYSFEKVQV